ncbi:MAG: pyruvate dehydrogenase E1 component subunit alpha [Rhodospirillaceae bacterium]|nr:MAG: pyruvate dehydrogenase E1 component subunit alpha [Rhodospirillaceae bacterium]
MFRRMCLSRANEITLRQLHQNGQIECLVYLSSVGQEAVAAGLSMAMPGAWVVGQHRCHALYLSFGGNHRLMIDEMLGLPSGGNRGLGRSPTIQDFANGIVGHTGLIGDQVPVAAGVAMNPGSRGRVVTVFGDGTAEEDYVLATLGFAATRRLPILFVCEDNDLSVLTPTRDRRSWQMVEVAAGFGLPAVDIADDPWLVEHWATRMAENLPALINVRTCRELWHVGTGCDGPPEWNRFELTCEKLKNLGLGDRAEAIKNETQQQVDALWNERLRTRSGI